MISKDEAERDRIDSLQERIDRYHTKAEDGAVKIHLAECDDWIAVYKDGQKVYENHSVDPRTLLEALGIPFTSVYDERLDIDFPDRLESP